MLELVKVTAIKTWSNYLCISHHIHKVVQSLTDVYNMLRHSLRLILTLFGLNAVGRTSVDVFVCTCWTFRHILAFVCVSPFCER